MNELNNFVSQLIANRDKYKERSAYRYYDNDKWNEVSWNGFLDNISRYASALLNNGIKEGEHIALYAPNCHEWTEFDYACMAINAVSVAIHATSSIAAVKQILEETDPRFVLVGNTEMAAKLTSFFDPQRLILIEGQLEGCRTLKEFSATDIREDWSKAVANTKATNLWTIVYTSGTTGRVRGAMLTYGNLIHQIKAHREVLTDLNDSDSSFCLLPLSHIFERGWSAIQYAWGMTHHYCTINPETIHLIKSARPSVMCTVPRILEKIYSAFNEHLSKKPSWFRKIFKKSLNIGKAYAAIKVADKKPGAWLKFQHFFADKLIFSRIRNLFGGKIKHCVVGSASLLPEVHEFFRAAGLFINNGYGLTETTATISSTPIGHSTPGSVGTTLKGLELRLGPDNEIQVKGPSVMLGYYKNDEENAKVFTEDGFFRTGDVGTFASNGYLMITDRIKDMIRTSTGKYVAPQHLEACLDMCPYINQAAIVGEGRSWIGALIVPHIDKLKSYAQQMGIAAANLTELLRNPGIINFIQKQVDELLAGEAKHERVHRITLIERPFTIENGELTPTLKLRRKVINEHYQNEISSMFGNHRESA